MKTFISKNIKLLALSLVIGLSVSYVGAWTGPTAAPTGGNTPAPINVGSTEQVKTGTLKVTGFRSFLPAYINYGASIDLNTKPAAFQTLSLGVNGKVGASQYCDINGENCSASAGGVSCSGGVFSGSVTNLGSASILVSSGINASSYPYASVAITGGDFSKKWRVETQNVGGVWNAKVSPVEQDGQTQGPLYFNLLYSTCSG